MIKWKYGRKCFPVLLKQNCFNTLYSSANTKIDESLVVHKKYFGSFFLKMQYTLQMLFSEFLVTSLEYTSSCNLQYTENLCSLILIAIQCYLCKYHTQCFPSPTLKEAYKSRYFFTLKITNNFEAPTTNHAPLLDCYHYFQIIIVKFYFAKLHVCTLIHHSH